jgi:hypothetical protein
MSLMPLSAIFAPYTPEGGLSKNIIAHLKALSSAIYTNLLAIRI